jgi:hypothetical protein
MTARTKHGLKIAIRQDEPSANRHLAVIIVSPTTPEFRSLKWCAPSCEEFAYRFWIENRLWRSLHEKPHEADAELRRYLDHYRLR